MVNCPESLYRRAVDQHFELDELSSATLVTDECPDKGALRQITRQHGVQ